MGTDTRQTDESAATHRIPVIDKMMRILELVEQGVATDINTLTAHGGVPRSTVYRILNTLSDHGVIARLPGGDYRLSFRLVSLAQAVDTQISRDTLVQVGHSALVELAAETRETCKLSILVDEAAEVIDVVLSPSALAPSSRVGSRFELHAGAASKLLLAYAAEPLRRKVASGSRKFYTDATIQDADELDRNLTEIRKAGISHDRGEWNQNVHALAAPVYGVGGAVLAALSITYFAGADHADADQRLEGPLLTAAKRVSVALGYRLPAAPLEAKKGKRLRNETATSSKR